MTMIAPIARAASTPARSNLRPPEVCTLRSPERNAPRDQSKGATKRDTSTVRTTIRRLNRSCMPLAHKGVGRAAGWLLCALVVLGLSACKSDQSTPQTPPSGAESGSEGSALTPAAHFYAKGGAIPPGARVGVMLLFLTNQSDRPITLDAITPKGEGIGTVVDVTSIEAAPIPPTDNSLRFAPGGIYEVDPPAFLFSDSARCNVQALTAVDHLTLAPGKQVRVRMILRASAEGKYGLESNSVVYDQDGDRFVQHFDVGIIGSVDAAAPLARVPRQQAACVGRRGVQPLNP